MSEENDKFYNSALASHIGEAIFILALCLGIGGCNYLIDKGAAEKTKSLTTEESVLAEPAIQEFEK